MRLKLIVPAAAALGCALAAGEARAETVNFAATGAEQSFTVPAGVTSVHVVAVGGRGGNAFNSNQFTGGAAGSGARAEADLPVVPGQRLYVEVAGNGAGGAFNAGAAGGFNGGGGGVVGAGGGGGASDVRTAPAATAGSLNSRLLVAAGGGGGGEYGSLNGTAFPGGAGGAAGATGGDGTNNGGSVIGGHGGAPGTTAAGGARGDGGAGAGGPGGNGTAGTLASGGSGGGTSLNAAVGGGAGGGGGLYGGGGAGGGGCCQAGGGGGGGGSSFVVAGAAGVVGPDATGTPSVAISYPMPVLELDAPSLTFGNQLQGTLGAPRAVTLTNRGKAPLYVSGLSFTGANADDFLVASSTCGGPVEPGASCRVAVVFAPQDLGARAGALSIAGNAGPAAVGLAGTGTALAQSPPPPPVPGPPGAQGPPGPAGSVQLVTCTATTRTVIVKGKRVKRTRTTCTGGLVSGPVRLSFGDGATVARATLARGTTVYATGTAIRRGGRTRLVLRPLKPVAAGSYTLRLQRGARTTRETVVMR